ncbi:hypothetical protein DIPPA_08552 [Diplonema papillatum]|nr:hypothetical protein DIPPA_08552 [Diplonema papillatum]
MLPGNKAGVSPPSQKKFLDNEDSTRLILQSLVATGGKQVFTSSPEAASAQAPAAYEIRKSFSFGCDPTLGTHDSRSPSPADPSHGKAQKKSMDYLERMRRSSTPYVNFADQRDYRKDHIQDTDTGTDSARESSHSAASVNTQSGSGRAGTIQMHSVNHILENQLTGPVSDKSQNSRSARSFRTSNDVVTAVCATRGSRPEDELILSQPQCFQNGTTKRAIVTVPQPPSLQLMTNKPINSLSRDDAARDLEEHTQRVRELWEDLKVWRTETETIGVDTASASSTRLKDLGKERVLREAKEEGAAVLLALRHMAFQMEKTNELAELQLRIAVRLAALAGDCSTDLPEFGSLASALRSERWMLTRVASTVTNREPSISISKPFSSACEEGYDDYYEASPLRAAAPVINELGDIVLPVEDLIEALQAAQHRSPGRRNRGSASPKSVQVLKLLNEQRVNITAEVSKLAATVADLKAREAETNRVHQERLVQLNKTITSLESERDALKAVQKANKEKTEVYGSTLEEYVTSMRELRQRCENLTKDNYALRRSRAVDALNPWRERGSTGQADVIDLTKQASHASLVSVAPGLRKELTSSELAIESALVRSVSGERLKRAVSARSASTVQVNDPSVHTGGVRRSSNVSISASPSQRSLRVEQVPMHIRPPPSPGNGASLELLSSGTIPQARLAQTTQLHQQPQQQVDGRPHALPIPLPSHLGKNVASESLRFSTSDDASRGDPSASPVDSADPEFEALSTEVETKLRRLGQTLTSPRVVGAESISPEHDGQSEPTPPRIRSLSPWRYIPPTPQQQAPPSDYTPSLSIAPSQHKATDTLAHGNEK